MAERAGVGLVTAAPDAAEGAYLLARLSDAMQYVYKQLFTSPKPSTKPTNHLQTHQSHHTSAFLAAAAGHYAFAVNAAIVDAQFGTADGAVHLAAAGIEPVKVVAPPPPQVGGYACVSLRRWDLLGVMVSWSSFLVLFALS